MNKIIIQFLSLFFLILVIFSFIACSDDDSPETDYTGAIFTMDNSSSGGNTVYSYGQNSDGSLTLVGSVASGGQGTGPNNVASGPGAMTIDPLASNYSLQVSDDRNYVFVVNAGSDEVSSLKIMDDYSLELVSTVSSGGADPISLANDGDQLYVLNSNEGVATLSRFEISGDGELSPDPNFSRTMAGRATAIRFTQDDNFMAAAIVNTNQIELLANDGGTLSETSSIYTYDTPEEGRNVPNPFGIETIASGGQQYIVIGEARVFTQGGELAPQTSALSTFSVGNGGALTVESLDIRVDNDGDDTTTPFATCWVVANSNGNQLVTANTNGNSMSTFSVNGGSITLQQSTGFLGAGGEGNFGNVGLTDQVIVGDYVYQVEAATGRVLSLELGSNGSLTEVGAVSDLNSAGGNQGIDGYRF